MKKLIVVLALGLGGCSTFGANAKIVTVYACKGCSALMATGVCSTMRMLPACPEGEQKYIMNVKEWEKGADPVIECHK